MVDSTGLLLNATVLFFLLRMHFLSTFCIDARRRTLWKIGLKPNKREFPNVQNGADFCRGKQDVCAKKVCKMLLFVHKL